MNFWTKVAGIILRNRYLVLITIAVITGLLATQMKYMKFSYTEANLLPENHEANLEYNKFLEIFGEEGNLVSLCIKDSTVFTPHKFNSWNNLVQQFENLEEIDFTISIADVKKLKINFSRNFLFTKIYFLIKKQEPYKPQFTLKKKSLTPQNVEISFLKN
jgi:predicted RND superfamily exporter protein